MEFRTERLILRPWEEGDAKSLYEYAKNPEVGPIAGWPVHTSVKDSLSIIRNVLSAPETYAVCLKEDNRPIGSVGLIMPMQSHTRVGEDEIEIGYWIGVDFWGNGYIPEAVRRMQRHVFEDLGCSAMWCGYYDGNSKSKRCQEKCGFVFHHTEADKSCALMGDVRTEHFTRITKKDWEQRVQKARNTVIFYVHGKGGNAEEGEYYRRFFPECNLYGLDYKTNTPWETREEIRAAVEMLTKKYSDIILVAGSVGAFFAMNAGIENAIKKAYFISPIVNMEKLIVDMIGWANTTEEKLEEKEIIETDFGEPLSWKYLSYVRDNPIHWDVPTEIIYGERDNLTSLETVSAFANQHDVRLTIVENGEHWLHTEEQIKAIDDWMKRTTNENN